MLTMFRWLILAVLGASAVFALATVQLSPCDENSPPDQACSCSPPPVDEDDEWVIDLPEEEDEP